MPKNNCWHCGAKIEWGKDNLKRPYCESCGNDLRKKHKEIVDKYGKIKAYMMGERAVELLINGGVRMSDYEAAYKQVHKKLLRDDGTFKSSDEVAAAIVLLQYGWQFAINKRIGTYMVDFFVPEWKICLEIDGERHEHKKVRDSIRDSYILGALGAGWEVIRVPTGIFERKPEYLPILALKLAEFKRESRIKYGGFLPEKYFKDEVKKAKEIIKG